MNSKDTIRKEVYSLKQDRFKLNYLTILLDIYNHNPLFNDKERQHLMEELIAVQREVVNNMFAYDEHDRELYYQALLRKLNESYE